MSRLVTPETVTPSGGVTLCHALDKDIENAFSAGWDAGWREGFGDGRGLPLTDVEFKRIQSGESEELFRIPQPRASQPNPSTTGELPLSKGRQAQGRLGTNPQFMST